MQLHLAAVFIGVKVLMVAMSQMSTIVGHCYQITLSRCALHPDTSARRERKTFPEMRISFIYLCV